MEKDNPPSRIMVVDDDEGLLKAIRRELKCVGQYEVELFTSPEVALIRAKTHPFDLLISDYKMPWMHGLTFMHKFAQLQPCTPIIVVSGDTNSVLRHCDFNDITLPYLLGKPWQATELMQMVEEALQVPPPSSED